jgi:hypothetical protein
MVLLLINLEGINMQPLNIRHANLVNTPNYYVSGGQYNHALATGDLVSPEVTTTPTASGIEQYMVVRVFGSVTNSHASQVANITPFGAANLIQRIEFTDTGGYLRHSGVSGRTLELMAYARQYDVIGGALMEDANYGVSLGAGGSDIMPATVAAAGGTASFSHTFVIPFAYSAVDMRGAIPALLQQGQQSLKVRFPTKAEAFVSTVADKFKAIYSGGTLAYGSLGYEVITVTKNRNLPQELPTEVFADVYQITEGTMSSLSAGTDNKFAFEAGRTHFNLFAIFNNGGTLNYETDVGDLSLLFGGSQDAFRASPYIHNAMAKNTLKTGLPPATYYMNFRADPMNVMEKGGSIDFIIRPLTVNTGANVQIALDYIQSGIVSTLQY